MKKQYNRFLCALMILKMKRLPRNKWRLYCTSEDLKAIMSWDGDTCKIIYEIMEDHFTHFYKPEGSDTCPFCIHVNEVLCKDCTYGYICTYAKIHGNCMHVGSHFRKVIAINPEATDITQTTFNGLKEKYIKG